jgi:hypothetical protein
MKTTIALALMFAAIANARPLSFAWNAPDPATPPPNGYEIITRAGVEVWTVAGETSTLTFSGEFPDGEFQVAVKAFRIVLNEAGQNMGRVYSERSGFLTVPIKPPAPSWPRLQFKVLLRSTDDLQLWKPVGEFVIDDPNPKQEFFQLTFP